MKKRLVIVGGGFAGISAARFFSRFKRDIECTVIDRKNHFEFLPLLPDVIGGKIRPDFLMVPLETLSKELNFNFKNDCVEKIILSQKKIFTGKGAVDYDYALITCGSETNFYGNAGIEAGSCKLDNVEDAGRIVQSADRDLYETYVVSGGGYTGIEVATNLRLRLEKAGRKRKIIVVEGSPLILGLLPGWMRDYTTNSLKKMEIEVAVNTRVAGIEKHEVVLSDDRRISGALLIWTAGVKTPDFLWKMGREKNPQGRISVDKYLRIDRFCFLAGDTVNFNYAGKPLRMSVQFALSEGRYAALNIIRDIKENGLKKYKPFDPGYVIPLAAGRACGKTLKVNVRGRLALYLHYLMCIYRSYGVKNRFGILNNLLKCQKF